MGIVPPTVVITTTDKQPDLSKANVKNKENASDGASQDTCSPKSSNNFEEYTLDNDHQQSEPLKFFVKNKEGECATLEPSINNPFLTNIRVDSSQLFLVDEKFFCTANVVLEFTDGSSLRFDDFPLKLTKYTSESEAA